MKLLSFLGDDERSAGKSDHTERGGKRHVIAGGHVARVHVLLGGSGSLRGLLGGRGGTAVVVLLAGFSFALMLGSGLLMLRSGLLMLRSGLLMLRSGLLMLGSGLLMLGSGLLMLGSGLAGNNEDLRVDRSVNTLHGTGDVDISGAGGAGSVDHDGAHVEAVGIEADGIFAHVVSRYVPIVGAPQVLFEVTGELAVGLVELVAVRVADGAADDLALLLSVRRVFVDIPLDRKSVV